MTFRIGWRGQPEVPGEVRRQAFDLPCYIILYYVILYYIILYYIILYYINIWLYNFIHQKKLWSLSLHCLRSAWREDNGHGRTELSRRSLCQGSHKLRRGLRGGSGWKPSKVVKLSQVWGCDLWVFSSDWPGTISTCVVHLRGLWLVARRGGNPRWVTSILLSACGPQDHICIHSLQIVVLESHPEIWISGKWPLEWLFFHVGTKNPWNRQVWNFSWLDCLYLFNLYAMYLFIYPKSTAVSALFWHVS